MIENKIKASGSQRTKHINIKFFFVADDLNKKEGRDLIMEVITTNK